MARDAPTRDRPSDDITTSTVSRASVSLWPLFGRLSAWSRPALLGIVVAIAAVEPASAQESIGTVYCGTTVKDGIDTVFSAVAGLGLPATMFYMMRGGVSYMRAGHRPQKKDEARDQFTMAAVGFGIIVLALAAPGIIGKFGGQLGFSFLECVRPF